MSIMVATGKAATQAVVFRDAADIERLRTGDTRIVDKTGTLTEGEGLRARGSGRRRASRRGAPTRHESGPGQRASARLGSAASAIIFGTTVGSDRRSQDDVAALLAKRRSATRRPVRDTSVVP